MSEAIRKTPVEPGSADTPKWNGRRRRRAGSSLLARGEPMLWMSGGGLVTCLLMVIGLLGLVLWQGLTTFWPSPVVQVKIVGEQMLMGEITRQEVYELELGGLAAMSGSQRDAAAGLLNPRLRNRLMRLSESQSLENEVRELAGLARKRLTQQVEVLEVVQNAAGRERAELLATLGNTIDGRIQSLTRKFLDQIQSSIQQDEDGTTLFEAWDQLKRSREALLEQPTLDSLQSSLTDDADSLYAAWSSEVLSALAAEVGVSMRRRLIRTGNFDLTGNDFNWVSDFEIADSEDAWSEPEWALLFERLAWGRFYGFPKELRIDGATAETEPAEIWKRFLPLHAECRERWQQRRDLEKYDTGKINARLESARLAVREVELAAGRDSEEWKKARADYEAREQVLQEEFDEIRKRIVELDDLNGKYTLLCEAADGQEKELELADIVRVYPPNRLTGGEKSSIYLSRWSEFLLDDPREANSEGGVFPAIFGTVIMTMMMSIAVVPFGVLAALYLREYAKSGPMVSIVRIAVNNLAGVPSIVFGVFGLGFFCYIIGASIDDLFYAAKLPNPTYGTGGLMWASLTLALLTLPVVIVATEEALSAVPRSMREGSLACGATKWQTIRHIVLPRAMPGIMTGMILAMARGAGEVAPLMLVGAVKLAPELCLDLHDLSGSLGWLPTGPLHAERSFMHLGFHIYDLGFQSRNSEAAKPMVYTTTMLLIGLIATMNVLAIWLRARLRKKFQFSQF
jgi:phosphate transport system permease protein